MELERLVDKACYALRLMHLARWITRQLADDYERRVVGRLIMILLPAYIEAARAITRSPELLPLQKRELRTRLRRLEKDFVEFYAQIRHDLAAHRDDMPLDEAIEAWNQIDSDTLDWFLEHSLESMRGLVAAHPLLEGQLEPFKTEARAEIAEALASRPVPDREVARVSNDSLALTRGEISIIPVHRVQARVGTVLSTMGTLTVTARLLDLVGHDIGAYSLLKSSYIIDVVSLIDAVYGGEFGGSHHRTPSLLEIFEEDDFGGAKILRASIGDLDAEAVAEVRCVRNRACAHLDPGLSLDETFDLIHHLDPEMMHSLLHLVIGGVEAGCKSDRATSLLLISGDSISGLRPSSTPGVRPFARC